MAFQFHFEWDPLKPGRMRENIVLRLNVAPQCSWIRTPCRCSMINIVKRKKGGQPWGWMRLVYCWLFPIRIMKKRNRVHEYG